MVDLPRVLVRSGLAFVLVVTVACSEEASNGAPVAPESDAAVEVGSVGGAGAGGSSTAGTGGFAGIAGASGEGGGGTAGNAAGAAGSPNSCEGVLLQNVGLPADYPPTYATPKGAQAEQEQKLDAFLASQSVQKDDYEFGFVPVTLAPELSHVPGASSFVLLPGETQIDSTTSPALLKDFAVGWSSFFGDGVLTMKPDKTLCTDQKESPPIETCTTQYLQDYCGLSVASDRAEHKGLFRSTVYTGSRGYKTIEDWLIPVIPVYVTPLFSPEKVRASLVGYVLTRTCGGIVKTATLTDSDTIEVNTVLTVFAHQKELSVGNWVLEYRTAYRVLAVPPSEFAEGWTVYVDALEGQPLYQEQNFYCGD